MGKLAPRHRKALSFLDNLVHEDAAFVVLGLDMTLHEFFLMFRKAGEPHRSIMLYQFFFWQGVDIQGVNAHIHRHPLDNRENELLECIEAQLLRFRMRVLVALVDSEIRKFNGRDSSRPELEW